MCVIVPITFVNSCHCGCCYCCCVDAAILPLVCIYICEYSFGSANFLLQFVRKSPFTFVIVVFFGALTASTAIIVINIAVARHVGWFNIVVG